MPETSPDYRQVATPPLPPPTKRRLSQVECIGCGAEPDEECASFCGNGCQTCVDEAAGFVLVPPHTCEDEW